jgi:hypothetical protein
MLDNVIGVNIGERIVGKRPRLGRIEVEDYIDSEERFVIETHGVRDLP